jgi:Mg-chelatase subunit ChlD
MTGEGQDPVRTGGGQPGGGPAADGGTDGGAVIVTATHDKDVFVGAAPGVHAILDVRTRGLDAEQLGSLPEAAEVIVVDCSGSMGTPATKMAAARQAAIAAINAMRDGTWFAVVEGTHTARMVYPPDESLARADSFHRGLAASRIRHLYPSGGTAIGAWLALTRRLLAPRRTGVRHAILLTDGWNVHYPELLAMELRACEGQFVCDARGIGEDWRARELKEIADRLHGSADAVLRDADLQADFEKLIRASMRRTVSGLPVRITLSPGVRLRYFKQVTPRERDLTEDGRWLDEMTAEFPTQPWEGEEQRQYHLCLDADPAGLPLHEELQLAFAQVLVPADRIPAPDPAPVLVRWLPGEDGQITDVGPVSVHVSRYVGLARALAEAFDAYERQDPETVAVRLGEAVRLAHEADDQDKLELLAAVVDIIDAATGHIRLKEPLHPLHMGRLWMNSSAVAPMAAPDAPDQAAPPPDTPDPPPDRSPVLRPPPSGCVNPGCSAVPPPQAKFCGVCGHPQTPPRQESGTV